MFVYLGWYGLGFEVGLYLGGVESDGDYYVSIEKNEILVSKRMF